MEDFLGAHLLQELNSTPQDLRVKYRKQKKSRLIARLILKLLLEFSKNTLTKMSQKCSGKYMEITENPRSKILAYLLPISAGWHTSKELEAASWVGHLGGF